MSIDKITSEDGLSQSKNLIQENIEQLKKLFPEIVSEGKIDFKSLQQVLGEEIEEEEEFYRFTWAGKSQSRREAHKPSTGTLRPCKEESLDWDTTQNLYIEGDNLEVLKLLQKSYSGKIKMIYIDPPYNTGKDFVYKDNYKDNLKNYQEVTGQVDSEGNKISTNTDSDGRYHSNWLNMMYPRLRLARNLLKDDGVILVSIDDNEIENLKKILSEVFGESNFISQFIWRGGRRNAAKLISTSHEYMICYTKNIKYVHESGVNWKEKKRGIENIYSRVNTLLKECNNDFEKASKEIQNWYKSLKDDDPSKDHSHYCWIDKRGLYFASDISRGGGGGPKWEIKNPETGEVVKTPKRGWAYNSLENLIKDVEKGIIHFNGDSVPCKKRYLIDNEEQLVETVFYRDRRGASKRLDELFGEKVFDFPKDEIVLQEKIRSFSSSNEIVLDFFSGSGSTADAVLKCNFENELNNRFILVQLPEKIENPLIDKSFKTISDIGKERIKRVSRKIKDENPDKSQKLDLGFKVFKLDSSNIKSWDGNPENLESSLFDSVSNIKSDRTEEDVLYEILLKYGLDLTLPIEERSIHGKKVFNVGMGSLFICLGDEITSKVAEGIGEWKEECEPEVCRVIFKDNGFTDVEKTNSVQILKRFGINEIRSI
jgi:adenine-specific DNA-methyltransferase